MRLILASLCLLALCKLRRRGGPEQVTQIGLRPPADETDAQILPFVISETLQSVRPT